MTPLQIAILIFFTLFTLTSILAYIFVLAIVIVYFKEFKSNFYIYVISLGVPDLSYLCLILFYSMPCTIFQYNILEKFPYLGGPVETVSFFAVCNHLLLIAVYRFCHALAKGVNHPKLGMIFERKSAILGWIALLWGQAILMPVLDRVIAGCDLRYNYEHMGFSYECDNATLSSGMTDKYMLADTVLAGLFVCSVAAFHLFAWLAVYIRGRTIVNSTNNEAFKNQKRQKRILFQFTVIALALIIFDISFWVLPIWLGQTDGLVIITLFGMFNSATGPFTYLAFNKLIKAKAKHWVRSILKPEDNAGTIAGNSTTRVVHVSAI